MPKRLIRKQLLQQRRTMHHDALLQASNLAQMKLIQLPEFISARCIALYAPFQNEINTETIAQNALANGSEVLFPLVCGCSMVLRKVAHLDELKEGAYGILEPRADGIDCQADVPDLIVVPGVAFDSLGHRVGYGKGYYDRFLCHPGLHAHIIGLCHDFQIVEGTLPAEDHDICLHTIVTEKRVLHCNSLHTKK